MFSSSMICAQLQTVLIMLYIQSAEEKYITVIFIRIRFIFCFSLFMEIGSSEKKNITFQAL